MTNNSEINDIAQEEPEINLREILYKYIVNWKWFIFSLLIAICSWYVFIKLSTPKYLVETNLLIKDNKNGSDGQDNLLKGLDLFSSEKVIDNEIQILKSKTILEKTVRALNLQTTYYSTTGVRRHEVYNNLPIKIELLKPAINIDYSILYTLQLTKNEVDFNGKKYPLNKLINTTAGLIIVSTNPEVPITPANSSFEISFNDVKSLVEVYSKILSIAPVSKQATVLTITLEEAIPQKGKDILNKLVFEYNKAAIEDKNKTTSTTLAFITDRLVKLQEELGTAEKKVENYKSGNKITDIGSQSQIFLQNVQGNDAQLSKVNIQLSVVRNIEEYLHASRNEQSQVPSMLGIEDPAFLGLVNQLSEAQLKKQSLLQTVPETNPIISSINDQIENLKQSINQSLKNLKAGLQITKQQLESKNASFQSVISDVPSKERGLLDVMRQQDIKNNLFTYLLQKREETEISLASTTSDSRTIDEASSSRYPVKPVKQLTFLVFLFLGLLVPVCIIYLRDLLNFKVSKRGDIEKVTKVPILAEISHSTDSSSLLVSTKPRSMIAEQIRSLRTNLNFIMPNASQKVILFTSSISGEGKSFISLNLGASLAMSGKKVVILELDLRKPKLHAGLEIDNDKGLSNYLIGEVKYDQILKNIPHQENYYIITSGPIPPNPAELLVNGKIRTLIDELREKFDYVLLDAPPVGLVTDAQILGEYTDATLFIVRHNYTAKSHIHAIENLNRTKKFSNLNLVMNSIAAAKGGYNYGYGYGYSYGYGGYYEEDETKKSNLLGKRKNK